LAFSDFVFTEVLQEFQRDITRDVWTFFWRSRPMVAAGSYGETSRGLPTFAWTAILNLFASRHRGRCCP